MDETLKASGISAAMLINYNRENSTVYKLYNIKINLDFFYYNNALSVITSNVQMCMRINVTVHICVGKVGKCG